jgi:peptidyl-prolyl cis-trans isomerase A (cyclophilin A)
LLQYDPKIERRCVLKKMRIVAWAITVIGIPVLAPMCFQAQAGGQTLSTSTAGQESWKDRAEYDLYDAIIKDQNPRTRLEKLIQWKERYPSTEMMSKRDALFASTNAALGGASAALSPAYVSAQNSGDRIKLNADNTFVLQEGGDSFSGTYSVAGATLTLHIVQLNKDVNVGIQENRLIVNGEEVWIAAGSPKSAGPLDINSATSLEPGLYATIDTSMGYITVKLFEKEAPLTVANFVGLARGTKAWTDPVTEQRVHLPLYNGTIFHRVIPGFMIQGGDPTGTGMGGTDVIKDEFTPNLAFDRVGRLAMGNAGPGTGSCQFFITEVPTPHLNGLHTIFGQVVQGQEVVGRIARVPKTGDKPITPILINAITFQRKPASPASAQLSPAYVSAQNSGDRIKVSVR